MWLKFIFNKGTKAIQWGKNSFFQQIVLEQSDVHLQKKKKKKDHIIIAHALCENWQCIIDLNVQP